MKKLCIIPARGGSKRFPRKNIALLDGKPLLNHSIEVALSSSLFESVVVTTEDPEIKSIAEQAGAKVHDRSQEFATDAIRLPEVCLEVIRYYESKDTAYKIFCLLQPTCPLRVVEDLVISYRLFRDKEANYCISTSEFEEPAFWALTIDEKGYLKYFWGDQYATVRQNLPRVLKHNGSIIWAKTEVFCKEKDFMTGSKAVPYSMPPERSVDIDYPINLKFAEFLINQKDRQ